MSRRRLSLWRIFRVPAAIAAFSLTGLVVALLGDGAWDWMGATFLASAGLVTLWAARRRRS